MIKIHVYVAVIVFGFFTMLCNLAYAQKIASSVNLTELYSISGPYKVLTTGGTFRIKPNGESRNGDDDRNGLKDCSEIASISRGKPITWPSGTKVEKAFLLWAASGSLVDREVLLNGEPIIADNCHLIDTIYGNQFFGCVADVSEFISPDISDYSLEGLAIDTQSPYSDYCTVLGGWSLVVVYSAPNTSEELNFIKFYEGFEWIHNDTLPSHIISGFNVADPARLSVLSIVWEGDPDITDNEIVRINDQEVASNLFDSNSTAFAKSDTFGVDVDSLIASGYVAPGDTRLTWDASTGGDLVIVQMVGIYDLSITGISGYVYEDLNGDGHLSNDRRPVDGVIVKLFDNYGNLIRETKTDSNGFYYFSNLIAGEYFVVVDSRTIKPSEFNPGYSASDVWAEQTWINAPAEAVAYCDTDADGDTPPDEITGEHVCFGGAYGHLSDDATALSTAEHKIKVKVKNTFISNVNFGFSFNVVTNINDKDDDVSSDRTCQGCLRQFIQNANAIKGNNTMRFVPAVHPNMDKGNGVKWWKITISDFNKDGIVNTEDVFPAIEDPSGATVIDGTAYSYSDGTSVRDTNQGNLPKGCDTVGVDEIEFRDLPKPELEVAGRRLSQDSGLDYIFFINTEADGITIKNLSVHGSGDQDVEVDPHNDIRVLQAGSGLLLTKLVVGLPPSGNFEDIDEYEWTMSTGIYLEAAYPNRIGNDWTTRENWEISYALVGYTGAHGIKVNKPDVRPGKVYQVEATHANRLSTGDTDGITFERGTKYHLVYQNCVVDNNGAGFDSYGGGEKIVWRNNTIRNNGWKRENENDSPDGFERFGARLFNIGHVFEKNIVENNAGPGVVVLGRGIKISQNVFRDNGPRSDSGFGYSGLAIDVHEIKENDGLGDGVNPNDGDVFFGDKNYPNYNLDYPVFTKVELIGNHLYLEGYIGTYDKQIDGTFDIEVYKADSEPENQGGEVEEGDGKNVQHGEGYEYLGTCTDVSGTGFKCVLTGASIKSGDFITAITLGLEEENTDTDRPPDSALDIFVNTSEYSANYEVKEIPKFECQPAFYQVIYNELRVLNPVTGDYDLIGVSDDQYNAIGWRPSENLIYGLGPYPTTKWYAHLLAVGADGVARDLGVPV
ncbi:MAG: hypothetical protein GXO35_03340, partial [Gammaproteobacteria bacterium]|nr:hypothetical protein [Gammaproteobacteria bacterium]